MTGRFVVYVCVGPTCAGQRGAEALFNHAVARAREAHLADVLRIEREVCLGHCLRGPNVLVAPAAQAAHGLPLAGEPGVSVHHGMNEAALDALVRRLIGH